MFFADGFYIPESVVVIGTMNDIDRSVESMDYALRRRFRWIEFEVNKESLFEAFKHMQEVLFSEKIDEGIIGEAKSSDNTIAGLATAVDEMNNLFLNDNYKRFGLGKHYFISQGQFAGFSGKGKISELKDDAFQYSILPTLKDYTRGVANEELKDEFYSECATKMGISVDLCKKLGLIDQDDQG